MATQKQLDNLKFFKEAIHGLSFSQGFYGRLERQLNEASEEDLKALAESLPEFKDVLDVVMSCEQ